MGCAASTSARQENLHGLAFDSAPAPAEEPPPEPAIAFENPVGVSLGFLEKFFNLYDVNDKTVREVVEENIKPVTLSSGCSYLNFLVASGKSQKGSKSSTVLLRGRSVAEDAGVFVSHTWSYKFRDLVSALRIFQNNRLHSAPHIFFYLDIFAVNQHAAPGDGAPAAPPDAVLPVIARIGQTVLVTSPWNQPRALGRLWCLYELLATLHSGAALHFVYPFDDVKAMQSCGRTDFDVLLACFHSSGFDCRAAEVTDAADRERIFGWAEAAELTGSDAVEAGFNERLQSMLRQWARSVAVERAAALELRQDGAGLLNLCLQLREFLAATGGNMEEVLPLYQSFIVFRERALGGNHPDYAADLQTLAQSLKDTDVWGAALPMLEGSLQARESALGADHLDVALSHSCLAELLQHQGKLEESQLHAERALAIREGQLDEDDPALAQAICAMAETKRMMGDHTQAEGLYRRALEIFEKDGTDRRQCATWRNNLALSLQKQGRLEEAAQMHTTVLGMWEEVRHFMSSPILGTADSSLEVPCREEGEGRCQDPSSSGALCSAGSARDPPCCGAQCPTVGREHPLVAATLSNMAELLKLEGRYAEALPLVQRSLQINEEALGPDHPSTATSIAWLADIYQTQGDYSTALALLKRDIEITRKTLGHDHPNLAYSYNNLAVLLCRSAKENPEFYPRALKYMERSQDIRETMLGPSHPEVAEILQNRVTVLQLLGRDAEATPLLERAEAIEKEQSNRELDAEQAPLQIPEKKLEVIKVTFPSGRVKHITRWI
ncbi:hypothetical protein CYMTET_27092 [Cymbomonas tetramitiformis]|uniref:Kinesin light chain n=1 Tax=Cymbomonas tetramitiformis TaxID=36881 RepID=A0AAE0FQR7_9CHLO|nr:hypothetical protein CYMTET_27092 [Cymbomonas tetramitiformis]